MNKFLLVLAVVIGGGLFSYALEHSSNSAIAINNSGSANTDNGTIANETSSDIARVIHKPVFVTSNQVPTLAMSNADTTSILLVGDASSLDYTDSLFRLLGILDYLDLSARVSSSISTADFANQRILGLYSGINNGRRLTNIYDAYKVNGKVIDKSRWECQGIANDEHKSYIRGTIFKDSTNTDGTGIFANENFVQLEVNHANASTGLADTSVGIFLRIDTTEGMRIIYNGETKFQIYNDGTISTPNLPSYLNDADAASHGLPLHRWYFGTTCDCITIRKK